MYTVSIYKPVKGWAAVVYGPDGPETTGPGRLTPQEAFEDAKVLAKEWDAILDDPVIGKCDVCGGATLNSRCQDKCHDEYWAKRLQQFRGTLWSS